MTINRKSVGKFPIDIYLCNFGEVEGSIQSGLRPVLVIQDDRLNQNSPTTIVATITTATKKLYLPSHVFLGEDYGLEKPSMVMMEQIRVVNQVDLLQYIGHVSDEFTNQQLTNAAKKTFVFWVYEPKDKTSIRCLCTKCLDAYKYSGDYWVRRLDPFQKTKEGCEKCNGMGWDYIVTPQKKHT